MTSRPRLDQQSRDRWVTVTPPRSEALSWVGIAGQLAVLALVALVCSARHMTVSVESDTVWVLSLYRDLFHRSFQVVGWIVPPHLYVVPDVVGIFVLFRLLPDPGWAFAAYAVLYLAAMLAVVLWIGRLVGSGANDAWAAGGMSVAAWVLLHEPFPFRVSTDTLFPGYHGGALLLGLLLTGCVLHVASARPARAAVSVAIALVIGLGVPSDLLLMPHFLAPLAVAVVAAAWRRWIPRDRVRPLVLPAAIGMVLAIGIPEVLNRSGLVWIGAGISHVLANPIAPSVRRFLADVPGLAHEEVWSVIAGIVWLMLTGWAAVHAVRAEDDMGGTVGRWRLLSLTIVLSMPASIAATVLNGRYENVYLVRHFLPAMLLPGLFISSPLWWRRGVEHAARGRLFAVGAAVCVLAVVTSEAMELTPASLRFPYPASVRCMDEVATRIGARSGLGDYWSAKLVRELSRKGVEVNQVDQRLARFEWMTNPDWFATTDGPTRRRPQYGFVIANNLPEDRIVATFGEPAERVDCAGLQVLVYGRPGDTVLRDWLTSGGA